MTTDILDAEAPQILATFGLDGEEIGDAHYARATQMALGRILKRLLQRDPEFLKALVAEAEATPLDISASIDAQLTDAAYATILQSAHRPNGPLSGEMDWLMYENPTEDELRAVGLIPAEVAAFLAPKRDEATARTKEAIPRHKQD